MAGKLTMFNSGRAMRVIRKPLFLIIAFLFVSSGTAFGADAVIATGDVSAVNIQTCAEARSDGESCIIEDGSYDDLGIITIDDNMTAATYIKAETPGGVTFTGTTRFLVTGDYWVIQDFVFSGFNGPSPNPAYRAAIQLGGDNTRVTNNEFKNSTWATMSSGFLQFIRICSTGVSLCSNTADDAEVDHNYFHDNNSMQGIIAYSDATYFASAPQIHHNYFKDWTNTYDANNFAIALTDNEPGSDQDMRAVVEWNVIDNWSGDDECLMVKNSSNTIRYNIFKDLGDSVVPNYVQAISLRLGEDNVVFNNWLFSTETTERMRGILVRDKGHKIVNNYFQGDFYAYSIYLGPYDGGDSQKAENVLVDFNTFVLTNSYPAMLFGTDTAPSINNTISNNLFIGAADIGKDDTSGNCTATFTDNISYVSDGDYFDGTGCNSGWPGDSSNIDQLTEAQYNALFTTRVTDYATISILDGDNEAIGNSTRNASYTNDFDGQARSDPADTGADEYSAGALAIEPISTSCVGPTWAVGYVDCDAAPSQSIQGVSIQ